MSIAVCRFLPFLLPHISPIAMAQRVTFSLRPRSGNGNCDSSDFVANGAACSCSCNLGWSGEKKQSKTLENNSLSSVLFWLIGFPLTFPSSSGPSCSVPYCPPFLLGSTSSCSFSSLTDVTKVSAYILSRDCAMVCPHIPALSSGVCDYWHGSSVADDGLRHMEVGGAQRRAPLRFPVELLNIYQSYCVNQACSSCQRKRSDGNAAVEGKRFFFFQFGCSFTPCVISYFLQESLLEDNVHRL
jgi:hypothetical protein